MTELKLVGPATQGQAQDLMAEANPEDGHFAQEGLDCLDGVGDRRRIAGAIAEEHAIRLSRQDLFRGRLRRHDGDVAAVRNQQPQDVLLDAEIEGDDFSFEGGPPSDRERIPRASMTLFHSYG
jgi:hypothetical protein